MKLILVSVFALLVLIVQTADGDVIPTPPPTTMTSTQQQILNAINNCRRNVDPTATNMLQVEWNKAAQLTAQKYAETCSMVHSSSEARRSNGTDCGENLYMASYAASWDEAINAFCNEKNYFEYGKGATTPGAVFGHYTALVWYNSYLVGCGVAHCPDHPQYKFFYVCHHCPAGNIQGQTTTPYEKGPSCGKCPSNCKDKLCTNPCRQEADVYSNCKDLKDYCPYDPNIIKNCKSSCNCKNNEII
ncbi:cysteine-rich secretory protein 3-like [Hyperolius riggenbachi]|uniref:cysteine-rich secretory protein 3-like n=1 Tax=Hyperolius riggenbachi TaxID=752182 RepID=UPI0035A2623F